MTKTRMKTKKVATVTINCVIYINSQGIKYLYIQTYVCVNLEC